MRICKKYFKLIDSFLSARFQRVLPNGQTSKWSQNKAGDSRSSILEPLLFLVYISDLPDGLTSNDKFLLMIFRFSRWFVTQLLQHYLLMRTYPKYRNGSTNRKCYLILMLQDKPKKLFSQAEKILLNHNTGHIYFSNMSLTFSWRRSLSHRNQSMDWFLYGRDLCHERFKKNA